MRSVTGQTPDEVFQKKAAFANAFVQRPEFTNIYAGMTDAVYVETLMGRYGLTEITTIDPATMHWARTSAGNVYSTAVSASGRCALSAV